MKAWHISPARNRPSIETEGLRVDGLTGIRRDGTPIPKYLWLFTDFPTAVDLARCSWACSRDNDIWEADLTGYTVEPDPHPGWGDERDDVAVVVTVPVPPERLIRATP